MAQTAGELEESEVGADPAVMSTHYLSCLHYCRVAWGYVSLAQPPVRFVGRRHSLFFQFQQVSEN